MTLRLGFSQCKRYIITMIRGVGGSSMGLGWGLGPVWKGSFLGLYTMGLPVRKELLQLAVVSSLGRHMHHTRLLVQHPHTPSNVPVGPPGDPSLVAVGGLAEPLGRGVVGLHLGPHKRRAAHSCGQKGPHRPGEGRAKGFNSSKHRGKGWWWCLAVARKHSGVKRVVKNWGACRRGAIPRWVHRGAQCHPPKEKRRGRWVWGGIHPRLKKGQQVGGINLDGFRNKDRKLS